MLSLETRIADIMVEFMIGDKMMSEETYHRLVKLCSKYYARVGEGSYMERNHDTT